MQATRKPLAGANSPFSPAKGKLLAANAYFWVQSAKPTAADATPQHLRIRRYSFAATEVVVGQGLLSPKRQDFECLRPQKSSHSIFAASTFSSTIFALLPLDSSAATMSTYRCPAGHPSIRPDLPCRECALGILALHNRDFGQHQFDNSYAAPYQAQQQGISQPYGAPLPGPPPFSNQQFGAPQQGQSQFASFYHAAPQQAHLQFGQQAVPPSASYYGLIGAPHGAQNTISIQSGWWPSQTQPQQPSQVYGLPQGASSGAPPAPLPDQLLHSHSNTVQPPRSPSPNSSDREHGRVNLRVSAQLNSNQSPIVGQPSSAATQSRVEASRHADQTYVPSTATHLSATTDGRTKASRNAKSQAKIQEQDDPVAIWNDLKRLGLVQGYQRAGANKKRAISDSQHHDVAVQAPKRSRPEAPPPSSLFSRILPPPPSSLVDRVIGNKTTAGPKGTTQVQSSQQSKPPSQAGRRSPVADKAMIDTQGTAPASSDAPQMLPPPPPPTHAQGLILFPRLYKIATELKKAIYHNNTVCGSELIQTGRVFMVMLQAANTPEAISVYNALKTLKLDEAPADYVVTSKILSRS